MIFFVSKKKIFFLCMEKIFLRKKKMSFLHQKKLSSPPPDRLQMFRFRFSFCVPLCALLGLLHRRALPFYFPPLCSSQFFASRSALALVLL